jgi:hypothetical protein
LCRLGFWLLCVLPACAIVAASWWVGSDAHRLASQQQLSERFGLSVTFEGIAWTHPDGMRFDAFKLADPESGAMLATARSLRVVQQEGRLFISADGLELHAARLIDLQELVNRQLRLGKLDDRIRVAADKVVVVLADKSRLTMEGAQAQCDFTKTAAQAKVEFRPVDREHSGVVAIRVVRNRQTTPPSVGFEIDATGSPLPCCLVAPIVPAVAQLGENCRFRGGLWGISTPDGWNAEFAGRSVFEEVDLATLVAESFPGQLEGKANLTVEGAKIVAGRIERMHGDLTCGGGAIHRELAKSLAEDLSLDAAGAGKTFGASHPFSELAFGFALDAEGLLISGRCGTGPKGSVLVDRFGIAITEPAPAMRLPVAAIERAFSACRAELIGVLPNHSQGSRR